MKQGRWSMKFLCGTNICLPSEKWCTSIFGGMLESRNVRISDREEGGPRKPWIESESCDQGRRGRYYHRDPRLARAGCLGGVLTLAGGEGSHARSLWQFPNSPGRQQEQRVLFLTHEYLRHLAVP